MLDHTTFIQQLAARNHFEPEYLQAVREVAASLWPFLQAHPDDAEQGLLERPVEPERVLQFRVAWVDDAGAVQVNRGWRVQHSLDIGPGKGGLPFHPTVNLSVLTFLAFEQMLKNELTTLPLGGAKGGADFNPNARSDAEVMRFCQAFACDLFRHVGSDTDVQALAGTPCRTFMADMKLRPQASDDFFYPNVFVTCAEADRADPRVKREPRLIVEVSSPSTAAYDRGEKFARYRAAASLQEVVFIDLDTRRVDVHRRGADGLFVLHPFEPGQDVELASVGVTLTARQLWAEVDNVASGGPQPSPAGATEAP